VATVSADPGQVVVSGPSLAAAPAGKAAHFTLNNVHGGLDDVEVSVEGKLKIDCFYFNQYLRS
jgi:hypothetical protein